MIITIDGPAAAGKGTLARRLAAKLDYAYLDSGALYRAVALKIRRAGSDPRDQQAAALAAAGIDLCDLDDPELRDEETGALASIVAAHPGVRAALLERQRQFAAHPPNAKAGAVLDGRDMGTVVAPHAALKIFVTASAEERARRRTLEIEARGEAADFNAILTEVKARDARDETRAVSPLIPAADAHLLDTTELDIEAAFDSAFVLVEAAIAGF